MFQTLIRTTWLLVTCAIYICKYIPVTVGISPPQPPNIMPIQIYVNTNKASYNLKYYKVAATLNK